MRGSSPWLLAWATVVTAALAGCISQAQPAASQSDVELQVGVVQRFGSQPDHTMTLQAPAGDRLTLRFKTGTAVQTIAAPSVKFDIQMEPLEKPIVDERVVLATHRSFESAEYDANTWRRRGIPVEIAQPGRWQVWAKRDVYKDPTVRRLLLQSIEAQGIRTAFIDTKILRQKPRASFVANGFRYTRDGVEITSGQRQIQVTTSGKDGARRLYAGSLRLQPNAYGSYTLVNQVPLETYLRGVVPHEIGTGLPQSVMETQTILARTYALRNLRRFAVDNYQLCATTQCQVYFGLGGTYAPADRAIETTRGKVLTYQNELVDAVYSSATGGVTAPFHDVWNGTERPYLKAIVDSVSNVWDLNRSNLADEKRFRQFINQRRGFNEERQSNYFRWRVESSLAELNKQLRSYLTERKHPLANFRTIQRMDVTRRSPSGRVLQLTVTTDRGAVELEKDNILVAFEAPNSTLFYLEPTSTDKKTLQGYAFIGGGLGHGVGLSQTGSYYLGQIGWSSDRILRFYYPGTQLQPLSSAITLWREEPIQPEAQPPLK